ncbi:hypothetical protein ACFL6G_04555 [candidate division KSB1 bacterium]
MKTYFVLAFLCLSVLLISCQKNDPFTPQIWQSVVEFDRNPAWTPDGSQILFEYRREVTELYGGSYISTLDPLSGVWRVSTEGDSLIQLVQNDDIYIDNIKFDMNSDGIRLVFTFNKYILSASVIGDTIDGSNITTVALLSNSFNISYPKWNPVSEWILFENVPTSSSMPEIWMIKEDGTELQYLFEGLTPSWHPDGQSLIAANFISDSGNETSFIKYFPFTDAPPETLDVDFGSINIFPVYKYDGLEIAYQTSDQDSTYINIMNTDGTGIHYLTLGGQPSWSPDGSAIAFTLFDIETSNIWLIDSDGGNLRQLFTDVYTLSKIK